MQRLCGVAHYSCRVLSVKNEALQISKCQMALFEYPLFVPQTRLGETIGPRGVSYESTLG